MEWVEIEEKEIYWEVNAEGEVIEGVIINVEPNAYGNRYAIENAKLERTYVLPQHRNLLCKLDQLKVGDKVRITYKTSKPTKKGNDYLIYKVELWQE